ncbi:MAG: prephenate dehydratase domain-containing protein [Myxococcota bacterium]
MSDAKAAFEELRSSLEEADDAIVDALNRRAKLIVEIADLKAKHPDVYLAESRDLEVVQRARERCETFPADAIEVVYREILSVSWSLVAPVSVAYLGAAGGFAHVAARRLFGAAAELRAIAGTEGLLEEVARERASFGVVPFETSSDGAVTATLQGLVEADVKICGELTIPASYHLLSATGNASDVDKIYAAPTAIAACDHQLRVHFPQATLLDVPSGEVARELAKDDHGAAAVLTDAFAGEDLRIVRERVEDEASVDLRFAVVGNEHPSRTGTDRTVVALAVADGPGALYAGLQPFAERGINLTRLESRPALRRGYRYLFFVELDGHITDRGVLTAVEELRSKSSFVKILGSYPRPS